VDRERRRVLRDAALVTIGLRPAANPCAGCLTGRAWKRPGGPTSGDGGNGQWFGPDLHWTGREWIEEVGTWLPRWANPFSFTRVSHIPGTRKAVVGVGSQGSILIGATGRLG